MAAAIEVVTHVTSSSNPSLCTRPIILEGKALKPPDKKNVPRINKSELDSYASFIRKYTDGRNIWKGKYIHSNAIKFKHVGNRFLRNLLMEMYGKCWFLQEAFNLFSTMSQPNIYSWNIIIAACGRCNELEVAKTLFDRMPKRDKVTWNAMLTTYAQHGDLEEARLMFDKMPERDIVSWNAMLAAYTQNEQSNECIQLASWMEQSGVLPDKFTYASMLDACAILINQVRGKLVHSHVVCGGLHFDVALGNAAMKMYYECGNVECAHAIFQRMPNHDIISWTVFLVGSAQYTGIDYVKAVFDNMPRHDVVSWTAIIAAYARHGYGRKAIEAFKQMQIEGIMPNKVTYIVILDACADLAAFDEGKSLHDHVSKFGYDSDIAVANALMNMYGKCGNLKEAQALFDKLHTPDIISWNIVLAAYSANGYSHWVIELFQRMLIKEVVPDKTTLVSILSACSCGCLVDEGCHYLIFASGTYGFTLETDHYLCIIGLLGQSGRLDEVEDLIKTTTVLEGNLISWMTMLACCRRCSDADRSDRIAEYILKLHPDMPFLME